MVQELLAETEVFHAEGGGASAMAREMAVPFLGRIPLDPALSRAAEEGCSAIAGASASVPALQGIIQQLLGACGEETRGSQGIQNGAGARQSSDKQPQNLDIDPLLSSRIHLGF